MTSAKNFPKVINIVSIVWGGMLCMVMSWLMIAGLERLQYKGVPIVIVLMVMAVLGAKYANPYLKVFTKKQQVVIWVVAAIHLSLYVIVHYMIAHEYRYSKYHVVDNFDREIDIVLAIICAMFAAFGAGSLISAFRCLRKRRKAKL